MSIDHINLRKHDLNLLLAFDALMEDRSVSKAAARLSLGQSAMSHALKRLRDLFGDDILVRGPGGLVPTDRALALWHPLRRALFDLEEGLAGAAIFDPGRQHRVFRLSVPDYVAALLAPHLVTDARERAPHVAYRIESATRADALAALEDGQIDALIAVARAPDWAVSEILFTDGFSTLYDPAAWTVPPSDLDAFCDAPHVLASQPNSFEGWVDEALAETGRRRTVVLSAARFSDAAACVAGGPVLLTLPSRAARYFACRTGLAVVAPPLPDRQVAIRLLRRKRALGAPDSEWLAETLRTVSGVLTTGDRGEET
ncbi:MAG: LysR substrate-binding domain-containing protein [Pseudomonadota bacterium]